MSRGRTQHSLVLQTEAKSSCPIKHKLTVPQKVSTDRVGEVKEEQIEVEVEEETPDAAVAADVRQLDQKVMKSQIFG